MTDQRSSSGTKTAPGEILELFKGGYLSVAETIAALDDLVPSPIPQIAGDVTEEMIDAGRHVIKGVGEIAKKALNQ